MLVCMQRVQDDEVAKVGLSKYSRVSRSAFGLNGKKRIAVLRAGGAIVGMSRHPATVYCCCGCLRCCGAP